MTKASADSAAVRIAMTVCEAGNKDGVLREVTLEQGLQTDTPLIEFAEKAGRINSHLTVQFVNTYRTMCIGHQPDFRRALEQVLYSQLAA